MADEISPGGSEIYRHEARERKLEPAAGDELLVQAMDRHLDRTFGDHEGMVFHELVSDLVHIDVHFVPPAGSRAWTTLLTSGMAERPMSVPEGLEDYRYAELVLALPSEWPLEERAFGNEANYWPVRLLKELARLPHEYDTFLWYGHTVPHGDPPEPYARGTKLCCALVGRPALIDEEHESFRVPDGREVHLYGVYPLHRDEMDLKLEQGDEQLWARLADAGVTELVDPRRESVVGRRRRLFGR
jgi:hypothetical protein